MPDTTVAEAAPTPLTVIRRGLMSVVMISAILLVFVTSDWLILGASGALALFLVLGWRRFGIGTWVPVLLSVGVLVVALQQGVEGAVLLEALGRMLFLAALIAVLGTLRSAASMAPEVAQAGAFLTGQPASRRYIALNTGGHLFGVLINFGGLALLLDMATRAMKSEASMQLSPELREVKLKRMSLAIVRGFGMISLWSPLGFATNAILITLPGISYVEFGPLGFAMSLVFVAVGWGYDQIERWRLGTTGTARPSPPVGAWKGAVILLVHVVVLGASVFILHEVTPLSFQQGLILVVPSYALLWAAGSRRSAPISAIRQALATTVNRLPNSAGEIGVFAAAGFLSVMLLALIPVDVLRMYIADLGLGPISLALGLSLSIVFFAMLGINPIVTASVMGAIVSQLAVPGLSNTAIALAITGGWTAVIGLSPFITTIILCSGIIERPVWRIGLIWNGMYCLTILLIWLAMLIGLMLSGLI